MSSRPSGTKGLGAVDRIETGRSGRSPAEVLVGLPGAGQLQGIPHQCGTGFTDADIGTYQPVGRAADGGETALVAEKLDRVAQVIHQGDPVRRPVWMPLLG